MIREATNITYKHIIEPDCLVTE